MGKHTLEYKGFAILARPRCTKSGQWEIFGSFYKVGDPTATEHSFLTSDTFSTEQEAIEHTWNTAKRLIKEGRERERERESKF